MFITVVFVGCSEIEIMGVYTNNNFDELPFFAEVPYTRDTLILTSDRTFTSGYYGKGTYEVKGGSLRLESKPPFHGARSFPIKRSFLKRKVLLVLSSDMNYYYEKIE